MRHSGIAKATYVIAAGAALLLSSVSHSAAQRPEPEVIATIDGDEMYRVLPSGAIPAIMSPEFVDGVEAEKQMKSSEPVMGLAIGKESRAYSLWQLDAHEIVNDVFGDTLVAVSW